MNLRQGISVDILKARKKKMELLNYCTTSACDRFHIEEPKEEPESDEDFKYEMEREKAE